MITVFTFIALGLLLHLTIKARVDREDLDRRVKVLVKSNEQLRKEMGNSKEFRNRL